jgi:hypothetical protein
MGDNGEVEQQENNMDGSSTYIGLLFLEIGEVVGTGMVFFNFIHQLSLG